MTGSAPVGPDERKCPFCRAAVPESADVCPQCGRILREHFPVVASVTAAPTETFTPPRQRIAHHARRRPVWLGIAVAMVLIVSAVIFGLVQPRRTVPGNSGSPVAQTSQVEQTGTMSVSSEPSGASILLDDRYTDARTPATITGVVPGPHDVRVRMTGYDDANTQVEVIAGSILSFSATLVKSKTVAAVVPSVSKPAAKPAIPTPPAQPATPKASPRPANGAILKRLSAFRGGLGTLSIHIDSGPDAIVKVVKNGSSQASVTVYLRSNSTTKVSGIPDGVYRILFATGRGYEAVHKTFISDISCSEFDDTFQYATTSESGAQYYSTWSITLSRVVNGNAASSDVPADSFSGY